MEDCQNEDLRVGFNRRLKLKFLESQVTNNAGLLAYRELDETLGLPHVSTVTNNTGSCRYCGSLSTADWRVMEM